MKEFDAIDWADAFSRLHPLLLHLPIGLFLALAWLQVWRLFKGRGVEPGPMRAGLVFLLVFSTPVTAASGWFLHEGGNYPDPMDYHKWCGISLAFVAVAIGWAHVWRPGMYTPLLWLGLLLLVPTAHFGGTLTHGEGFLTDPWMKDVREPAPQVLQPKLEDTDATAEPVATLETAPALRAPQFAAVQPIFEELCTRCHGARKQRGGLDLHTLEALLLGGDDGAVLVAGQPELSPLLLNLRLPVDDDLHMPPPKKSQPTLEQIDLIEAWIVGFDGSLPAAALDVASEREDSPPQAEPAKDPEQEASALQKLDDRLAHVQPLAEDNEALWIDFTATKLQAGELSQLLEPLRARVLDVCLANKTLDESDLLFLGRLPALERLDLRHLTQPALDLTALAESGSLQVLNLAGTGLQANAAEALAGMQQLREVFLFETGIEAELPGLRERRPALRVVAEVLPQEPLELEPEVQLERTAAPAPAPESSPPQIVNSTCPVTGKPVDPRYVVLYKGRAIGFCCPNCPKLFWEDPSKFSAQLDQQ